tara:strand:- start:605 stop:1339 length:735 start_codon:yes stop_codon:yes gene_type:complete
MFTLTKKGVNKSKTYVVTYNIIRCINMLIKNDFQKLIFCIKISALGAAVGFSFMVWYYLSIVPDHLQSAFLRSQFVPSRLEGLSALFIYGSTTISGFLIAYIFIRWLYEKPQGSGISKSTWILASLGYAIANAFIGGGIFMPLADQILQSINASASLGTVVLVIADHMFRIPLTMWLYGTQALYSSLISGFLFLIGGYLIYRLHEAECTNGLRINYSTVVTLIFSGVVILLSLVLPVTILRYLG